MLFISQLCITGYSTPLMEPTLRRLKRLLIWSRVGILIFPTCSGDQDLLQHEWKLLTGLRAERTGEKVWSFLTTTITANEISIEADSKNTIVYFELTEGFPVKWDGIRAFCWDSLFHSFVLYLKSLHRCPAYSDNLPTIKSLTVLSLLSFRKTIPFI